MFGLKIRDWIKREWEEDGFLLLSMPPIIIFFLVPLIILLVEGLISGTREDGTTSGPYPQCLYIGLPIFFGIGLPIISNLYFKTSKKLFNKAGFVWEKCPYIFWIIKGCIESIAIGLLPILFVPIIIVKYIGIPIGIGFIKIVQTIGVICTIPDGKAEARVKQIWSGK